MFLECLYLVFKVARPHIGRMSFSHLDLSPFIVNSIFDSRFRLRFYSVPDCTVVASVTLLWGNLYAIKRLPRIQGWYSSSWKDIDVYKENVRNWHNQPQRVTFYSHPSNANVYILGLKTHCTTCSDIRYI